jgi:hypothetical protein
MLSVQIPLFIISVAALVWRPDLRDSGAEEEAAALYTSDDDDDEEIPVGDKCQDPREITQWIFRSVVGICISVVITTVRPISGSSTRQVTVALAMAVSLVLLSISRRVGAWAVATVLVMYYTLTWFPAIERALTTRETAVVLVSSSLGALLATYCLFVACTYVVRRVLERVAFATAAYTTASQAILFFAVSQTPQELCDIDSDGCVVYSGVSGSVAVLYAVVAWVVANRWCNDTYVILNAY